MIENATNLTNTTVRASNGILGFLPDYWQEPLVLVAIMTAIILIILGLGGMSHDRYLQKKQHTHEKKMIKLQQENDKKIRQEEEESIQRDKKEIYDWLYDKTKHFMPNKVGSHLDKTIWPSTKEISSALDLTEERVHSICTSDKRIQRQEKGDLWPNQESEERWAVRKFVRDDD